MTNKAREGNFVRKPAVNLRRDWKDNIKKENNLCGKKVEMRAWKMISKCGFFLLAALNVHVPLAVCFPRYVES